MGGRGVPPPCPLPIPEQILVGAKQLRPEVSPCPPRLRGEYLLTAPARAAAAHAAVAAPVPGHDRAADRATRSVAHVDQLFHGVGRVVVSGDRAAGNALRRKSHIVGVTEIKSRSLDSGRSGLRSG